MNPLRKKQLQAPCFHINAQNTLCGKVMKILQWFGIKVICDYHIYPAINPKNNWNACSLANC